MVDVDEPVVIRRRLRNRPAVVAVVLAVASAAVTTYWVAGGTALLDTVGGSFERLARRRDAAAIALAALTIAAKLVAAAIALAALRQPTSPAHAGAVLWANRVVGYILSLYGGLLVIVGALVLSGGIHSDASTDRHALRWHVGLWDLWFLVWGLAHLRTARRFRSATAGAEETRS